MSEEFLRILWKYKDTGSSRTAPGHTPERTDRQTVGRTFVGIPGGSSDGTQDGPPIDNHEANFWMKQRVKPIF